jgi:hypothetical protein
MTPFRPTDLLPTTLILEAWIRFAASAPDHYGPEASALYADELLKEFLARWEPRPPDATAKGLAEGFDRGRLDQFGGGDP